MAFIPFYRDTCVHVCISAKHKRLKFQEFFLRLIYDWFIYPVWKVVSHYQVTHVPMLGDILLFLAHAQKRCIHPFIVSSNFIKRGLISKQDSVD